MYEKTAITSWITAVALCLITLISAMSKHNLSYQTLVSILSYIGVYAISLYLAKHNGSEKIILTFVNVLAVAMLVAMMVNAVRSFSAFMMILLLIVSIIGAITGIMAIWYNNRFEKNNSNEH
ncbi:hypothetical protein HC026_02485 [Lactobacillus sp. LC28-10]|uniref:Uncharacterized protein n=1 Tax=Secundilactobacillus angelensis TaxID=2722706 RepID=A0ABX1KY81_9LACO|nr:hypothetical protein [Secundilactobacillus angelensis]MCH5461404.1 hypothetical protein [Secundilactobacillus angelensis]NLR17783.1 hypothetical protein [Secundilactobacillus angelensis]